MHRILKLSADAAHTAPESTVPYDVVDSDGDWGPSTEGGTVEIATPGVYLMTHALSRAPSGAGSVWQSLITINDVWRGRQTHASGTTGTGQSATVIDRLEVGDVVVFRSRSTVDSLVDNRSSASIVLLS